MKKTRTQWLSKHWRESRKSENSGVAMIMVLIVGAVVLAFCLSLLLVAYSLFAQTSRQTGRQQCKLLAQSFSESLDTELRNPSSALSVYLSKQVQNRVWIGLNDPNPETSDPEAVTNLLLNLEDGGNMVAYHVTVELTYTQNVSNHEDVETEEPDDSDSEISQPPADPVDPSDPSDPSDPADPSDPSDPADPSDPSDPADPSDPSDPETPADPETPPESETLQLLSESGEGEEADPAPVILTYTIHASIKCVRGDVSDRDAQYYVMETTYPSVSFSTTE